MWHEQAGETNFALSSNGDLLQSFIGGPGDWKQIVVPGSEGQFDPDYPIRIERPTYNPDNPFHRIFEVTGRAKSGGQVCTFRWLGDRWEGYGGG